MKKGVLFLCPDTVMLIREREEKIMKKFVCSVCGYVYEGEAAPEVCPVCKAPASKFTKQDENLTWAAEHVVGVAQGVSEDILEDLRANFQGECSEVGKIGRAHV